MIKIKLSFIIACYNVEKYISACLDSILNNELEKDEYEIICVNDFSTDNTLIILEEYKINYSNIKIISHTLNRKVGAARNTGRKYAIGEYVWFIDGDDFIISNAPVKLIDICKNEFPEIIYFNYLALIKNEVMEVEKVFNKNISICTGLDFIRNNFNNKLSDISIVWHQIYKREFLINYKIEAPEVNLGEDGPFAWRALLYAQNVMAIKEDFYVYRCNDDSMTSVFRKKPAVIKLFEKSFITAGIVESLHNECLVIDNEIAIQFKEIAIWNANIYIEYIINNNFKFAIDCYSFAKFNIDKVAQSQKLFNKKTLRFYNILNKNIIYYIIWVIKEKVKKLIKQIYANFKHK